MRTAACETARPGASPVHVIVAGAVLDRLRMSSQTAAGGFQLLCRGSTVGSLLVLEMQSVSISPSCGCGPLETIRSGGPEAKETSMRHAVAAVASCHRKVGGAKSGGNRAPSAG